MCLDDAIPMAGPSIPDSLDFKQKMKLKLYQYKTRNIFKSCKLSKDRLMNESLSSRKMKQGDDIRPRNVQDVRFINKKIGFEKRVRGVYTMIPVTV